MAGYVYCQDHLPVEFVARAFELREYPGHPLPETVKCDDCTLPVTDSELEFRVPEGALAELQRIVNARRQGGAS